MPTFCKSPCPISPFRLIKLGRARQNHRLRGFGQPLSAKRAARYVGLTVGLAFDGQDFVFGKKQKFFAVNLYRDAGEIFVKDAIPFGHLGSCSPTIGEQTSITHRKNPSPRNAGAEILRHYKLTRTHRGPKRPYDDTCTEWDEFHCFTPRQQARSPKPTGMGGSRLCQHFASIERIWGSSRYSGSGRQRETSWLTSH